MPPWGCARDALIRPGVYGRKPPDASETIANIQRQCRGSGTTTGGIEPFPATKAISTRHGVCWVISEEDPRLTMRTRIEHPVGFLTAVICLSVGVVVAPRVRIAHMQVAPAGVPMDTDLFRHIARQQN